MKKSKTKKLNRNYWAIIGIATYLVIAISSVVRSIALTSFLDNLYMAIDWFAACIPYFFFGALIGFLIDWIIAKKNKKKIEVPLWFWLTIILLIGSTIIISIFSKQGLLEPTLIIFFPLAFGIFFVGSAFVLLMPEIIEKSLYGKIIFDLLYLGVFVAWIYLTMYKEKAFKITKKILLIIILLILFLGFAGCATNLI